MSSWSRFQSTCPARGTTYVIHLYNLYTMHFNPRAPRGARPAPAYAQDKRHRFQSTCPARGTTSTTRGKPCCGRYFNPRAPRGARPNNTAPCYRGCILFQSTCPARGTTNCANSVANSARFQSTCPARGTTANMHNFFVQICARVTNIPLKGMPYLQKTYVSI